MYSRLYYFNCCVIFCFFSTEKLSSSYTWAYPYNFIPHLYWKLCETFHEGLYEVDYVPHFGKRITLQSNSISISSKHNKYTGNSNLQVSYLQSPCPRGTLITLRAEPHGTWPPGLSRETPATRTPRPEIRQLRHKLAKAR